MTTEPLMRKRLEPFLKKLKHWEIFVELKDGSDRVVAIVAFAYLDMFLGQAVRSHFRENSRTVDDIFEASGILGSFEARRRVGYGLGLYGKRTFADLDTLNKIRNKFAHHHGTVAFTAAAINKLNIPTLVRLYGDAENVTPTPKETYVRTTRLLAGLLLSEATANSPPLRVPRYLPW
jgi:hypothetical protein